MSQTPPDSRKNDVPSPRRGPAVVVTVVGLMVGVAILLLLMVLRTNERGGGAVFPPTASTSPGPSLLISDTPEIKKWMTTAMKTTGAKVALVNIWATWCEPCRQEMPEIAKFQRLEKDSPVPVFLVSADNESDAEMARSFLGTAGVNFESVLIKGDQQIFIEAWSDKSSADRSNRWSMTLPVTFVIDSSAEILSFHVGTSDVAGFKEMVRKAQARTASPLDTAHD